MISALSHTVFSCSAETAPSRNPPPLWLTITTDISRLASASRVDRIIAQCTLLVAATAARPGGAIPGAAPGI